MARARKRPQSSEARSTEIVASIQLVDVYLWELHVDREPTPVPQELPTLEPKVVGHDLSDDRRELKVLLQVQVTYQFREEARAVVQLTLIGMFRNEAEFTEDDAKAYADGAAFVLMWPYARAMVAQIAGTMQVAFPPLPTLDVMRTLAQLTSPVPTLDAAQAGP